MRRRGAMRRHASSGCTESPGKVSSKFAAREQCVVRRYCVAGERVGGNAPPERVSSECAEVSCVARECVVTGQRVVKEQCVVTSTVLSWSGSVSYLHNVASAPKVVPRPRVL